MKARTTTMQIAPPSFSSTSCSTFGVPPSGGAIAENMLSLRCCNHCRILPSKRWASDGRTTTLFPLRRSRTSVPLPRRRAELSLVASAADSGQTSPTSVPAVSAVSGDKAIVPDTEVSLAKVSFGVIGLAVGGTLLSYGFGAYFSVLPGSEWSAIMLTYGFPLGIIGMALKYAELKPVPCITYSDAEALREKCSTPILKQVRSDVTRYRYGDEQHLDEALKRIFQYGQGGGIPRRSAPRLQSIREEVTEDGKYSLVLVFEAKALKLSDFEQRQAKFASFFGPGITSEIGEGEDDLYEVRLISETT